MELVPGNDDVRATGPGVKLTYDDFVLFPDDGKRHELIDGEHYVTPSPNRKHQKVSGNLHLLIGNWLEQHRSGRSSSHPSNVPRDLTAVKLGLTFDMSLLPATDPTDVVRCMRP